MLSFSQSDASDCQDLKLKRMELVVLTELRQGILDGKQRGYCAVNGRSTDLSGANGRLLPIRTNQYGFIEVL